MYLDEFLWRYNNGHPRVYVFKEILKAIASVYSFSVKIDPEFLSYVKASEPSDETDIDEEDGTWEDDKVEEEEEIKLDKTIGYTTAQIIAGETENKTCSPAICSPKTCSPAKVSATRSIVEVICLDTPPPVRIAVDKTIVLATPTPQRIRRSVEDAICDKVANLSLSISDTNGVKRTARVLEINSFARPSPRQEAIAAVTQLLDSNKTANTVF